MLTLIWHPATGGIRAVLYSAATVLPIFVLLLASLESLLL
jgi:hypothetical protein